MQFCEESPDVAIWSSEPVEIPYISALDNRQHIYYPDYIIESASGQRAVIEIKPDAQTRRPKETATAYDKEQWVRNCSKWKAAMAWCVERGYKFMIVTEKFFGDS